MSHGKHSPASLHLALKARVVEDLEDMEAKIFNFTQSIGHISTQNDIYFTANSGQIKLRLTSTSKDCDIGQLITSKSVPGTANLIETQSSEISEFKNMRKTLGLCLPEVGVVKKRRRVYVRDNIRINLDDVESLGKFVDIEIQGSDDDERLKQAEIVKNALEITDLQLVTSTYLELKLYRTLKVADSGVEDDETSDASVS